MFIFCLCVGSVLVAVYLLSSIYLIQKTTSLFVSIAANFKMITIILLSEVIVQNTKLNAGVYAGMIIVTLAFLGTYFHDQFLEKPKKADRAKSMCIKSPCLDRLSDPLCPPADPKNDKRRALCCRRVKGVEERPFLA